MSLESGRTALPVNKTERRSSKPQTDTQRIASEENFALFVLNGIKSQVKNTRAAVTISKSTRDVIDLLCDREIKRIKDVQEIRKEKK